MQLFLVALTETGIVSCALDYVQRILWDAGASLNQGYICTYPHWLITKPV